MHKILELLIFKFILRSLTASIAPIALYTLGFVLKKTGIHNWIYSTIPATTESDPEFFNLFTWIVIFSLSVIYPLN